MGGRHKKLRSLQKVVFLWIVLEEDMVVVCARPVSQALEHLLMVFKCPLCTTNIIHASY